MIASATVSSTKRVLVTGANKGIGLAIVEAVLEEHDDAFVLLGSRDAARGEAARAGLVDGRPDWAERVEVLELDVSNDDSVARAAQSVQARFEGEAHPLYGVVNNAGVGFGDSRLREVLEVNTNGVRRVSRAFGPMVTPEGGRVVNVTSAAGPSYVSTCSAEKQAFFLKADTSDEELDAFIEDCCATEGAAAFEAKGLAKGDPYGLSKACANAYTLMYAKANPELKVNACTPGFIATDLTKPYAEQAGKAPEEMGMKPPAEGTRSAMFLLFGEPEGNGRYYGSDALRSPLDRYRGPGTPAYEGD